MAKKEFQIGDEFQCGLVKLRVEKAGCEDMCEGCYMYDNMVYTCSSIKFLVGSCTKKDREDKTDVIFVEVED